MIQSIRMISTRKKITAAAGTFLCGNLVLNYYPTLQQKKEEKKDVTN